MKKIGLAGTVPVPCKDEEVSPGSTFFGWNAGFPLLLSTATVKHIR